MVLQVVHHLDLGGSEEVALAIAEQLQGPYDVRFYAINGVRDTAIGQAMKRRLDALDIPVHSGTHLEPKRGGFVVAALKLAALTRRLRPDIVHLHTEIPELTHALSRGFLNNRAGGPVHLTRTLHNTVYWGPWQRLGREVERRLSDVPAAACSHAALEGMRAFREQSGLGPAPEGQRRVIYNGVAPAPVSLQPTKPAGPLRVLFAGRLEPQKGVDLLPGILSHVDPSVANSGGTDSGGTNAELHIYGAGSLKPEMTRWANQATPGWTVRLFDPTPDIRRLMAGYDVMLMPSRFEGLGLVAAEALMAGLPVIGTRVAGLDEVFPADYPLLAASEDSAALGALLSQVLRDPQHFSALARNWTEETEEKFGLARMGREYHNFYQQLMRGGAQISQPQPSGAL
jgi:glycosyltransferase involved in cell wall biosynthesis